VEELADQVGALGVEADLLAVDVKFDLSPTTA